MNKHQQQQITGPGHRPHKSIDFEGEALHGPTSKKPSGYKYGSMIGKGLGNM